MRSPTEVLVALERECLTVDTAIAKRDWSDFQRSVREQRKLTHELDIVVRDLPRDSADMIAVRTRIDRLVRYRDGQLTKLRAYNASLAKQLTTIGKFRSYNKAHEGERPASRFLDINS